jgi:hypothetical protein
MNSYDLAKTILLTSFFLFVCVFGVPNLTFAATNSKPTCVLSVRTSIGTTTIQGKGEVLLQKGSAVGIVWDSTHATKAVDRYKNTIPVDGSATGSLKRNTIFSYTFSNGSKKVVCGVSITHVSGKFTTSKFVTNSTRPLISGKVSGIKNVQVQIFNEGSTTPRYVSPAIKVKKGAWSFKVLEKIPDGKYTIHLLGVKDRALNTFATSTLHIGKVTSLPEVPQGTLIVESVPLLLGGIVHPGIPVAISYLQLINIGKTPVSIQGFKVEQKGTALTESIIALTAVDDSGGLGGSTGGIPGETPFKDGKAFIPLNAVFAGGQMRLFTIKATLADMVVPYLGTQLKINVIGVDTNATIRSTFPIRGVTWTIGL